MHLVLPPVLVEVACWVTADVLVAHGARIPHGAVADATALGALPNLVGAVTASCDDPLRSLLSLHRMQCPQRSHFGTLGAQTVEQPGQRQPDGVDGGALVRW